MKKTVKKYYWIEQHHIDRANKLRDEGDKSYMIANPIAQAIKSVNKRYADVDYDGFGSYDTSSGNVRYFNLVGKSKTFMKNYCAGKKVKPCVLAIELVVD